MELEYDIKAAPVTQLAAVVPKPDERVVRALERLLEEAKAGTLRAFIASSVHHTPGCVPGGVSCVRAGRSRIGNMLFALERSKLRLMGFVEDVDLELDLSGTE